MKKIISLVLCLLLLCFAATALAAEYQPGDIVTVNVSVSSGSAVMAKIKVSASSSVFEFVEAGLSGVSGSAPNNVNGSFAINSSNTTSALNGKIGYIKLRIKSSAAPGSYSISLSASQIFDADFNSTSLSVSGGTTVVIPAPSCDHSYDAGTVTKPADCENAGEKLYTCTKCGDTKKEPIASVGHAYNSGVQTQDPTCKENGKKLFTCGNCGDTYTEDIPKTNDHTWNEGVVTKPMTCLENGEKTFTCTVCSKTDVRMITAPGKHTYNASDVTVEQAPTCTEPGKGSYTCTVCSTKIDGGVIAALGHDETETVTLAATCGADGEKVTTCSRCSLNVKTKIPATGNHNYASEVTKNETCGADGEKKFTCSGCGDSYTQKIPATGNHNYTSVVTKNETCGSDGEKKFTCSGCGDNYTQKIPATGDHTYSEQITTAPTCTAKGEKTFTCSVCNDKYTKEIAAKGHTPGSNLNEKKPTCSKPGYKYYTCTACGKDVKESDIPATREHIYAVTEETPATCTKNGKRVSKCTYEGCNKTKTETLKKLGHKMGDWYVAKAATCTANGQEKRDCLNGCGKVDTRTLKAGHNYGEWRVDNEAGTKSRVCGACGKTETKKLSINYTMTVCSSGIRFRDIDKSITKEWYMFTPVDLSVDGVQTIDLIAGNMHRIGTATIQVKEGKVTVTSAVNHKGIAYSEEFLAFAPSLDAITELNYDAMTNYAYGEEISIEEDLGGDTKVLLIMRNKAWYDDKDKGVSSFKGKGKEYDAFVEELKKLMD